MGKVIEFLARVGQDASLRHASRDSLGAVMDAEGFDAVTRVALMSEDGEYRQDLWTSGAYFSSQMPTGPDEEKVPDEDTDDDDDLGKRHEPPPGKSGKLH